MKIYTETQVNDLINRYTEKGGNAWTVADGVLGLGIVVLFPDSPESPLASFVIKEIALNEWSTAHTIRKYNRLPQKYAAIVQ